MISTPLHLCTTSAPAQSPLLTLSLSTNSNSAPRHFHSISTSEPQHLLLSIPAPLLLLCTCTKTSVSTNSSSPHHHLHIRRTSATPLHLLMISALCTFAPPAQSPLLTLSTYYSAPQHFRNSTSAPLHLSTSTYSAHLHLCTTSAQHTITSVLCTNSAP